MFRYIGLPCPNQDCGSFIIWKELAPNESPPSVRALNTVSGECPKCKRAYFSTADKLVLRESENRPTDEPPTLPAS